MLKGVAVGSIVPVTTYPAAASTATQASGIDVTIQATNSPLEAGAVLEVSAAVEHGGDGSLETDAFLVVGHDPTVVDSTSVQVGAGDSQTVDLTFETATVANDQEFPIWVVVDDATAQTDVLVYADGPPVDISIRSTNDPVTAGSTLQVVAELENDGGSQTTREVDLIVGHDPQQVDSTSVTVGSGETETAWLEFETAEVSTDQEFPVRVESGDAADEQSVLVTANGASVTVDIDWTSSPVAAGDPLEVTAHVENTGESTVTQTIELIVGHDPQLVDSETATLSPGTTQSITLGYETPPVENTQEFPVRVESEDDEDEQSVEVIGTDDDPVETGVTFSSCSRAEVSGTFDSGDNIAASTGFYDESDGEPLYGNTLMEDWIEVGNHVDAPFSGTIVFEIGDGSNVSETEDGVHVEVPDYGGLGTVLSGITMPPDYPTATITHSNPEAESCLDEISDGGGDEAEVSVSITGTNAPVDAGEFLEVSAALENTGDESADQSLTLLVGHDYQVVDSTPVSLEGGESDSVTLGYDTYPAAQTTEFPVRVESEDDADEQSVEVIGTEADATTEDADEDEDEDALEAEATEENQAADADEADDAEPASDDADTDDLEDADADGPDAESDEPTADTEPDGQDDDPESEADTPADDPSEPPADEPPTDDVQSDEDPGADDSEAGSVEADGESDDEQSVASLLGFGR